jgi:hypothetical protein
MCHPIIYIVIIFILITVMSSNNEGFGPFEKTAEMLCAGLPPTEKINCIKKNYDKVQNVCNRQFCQNVCMKEIDGVMVNVSGNPMFADCKKCNENPCGFYCSVDPNGYMCKVSCKNKNICSPMQYYDSLGEIPIDLSK